MQNAGENFRTRFGFQPPPPGTGMEVQASSRALRYASTPTLLAVFLAASFSFISVMGAAQDAKPPEAQAAKTKVESQRLYPDLPLLGLKRIIPALEGLRPAADQERLSVILDEMAETIANTVPRLPDIVSREVVIRGETRPGPIVPQRVIGLTRPGEGPARVTPQDPRSEQYQYLILCRRTANGATSIEEIRTDLKGRPLDSHEAGAPRGSGFAYQWLLFGLANQAEFRFSLLGEQEIEGRNTFVLAFAQVPGSVKFPATFQSEGMQAAYFYQGILWVDQATSNIVSLRSDIEAPLKNPRLEKLTTELHFRSVDIPDFDQSFWLPSEVRIEIDQGPVLIEEKHQYSDYHLYHASMRIVPPQ